MSAVNLLILLLLSYVSLCLGARILLYPLDHMGHVASMLSIGQVLQNKGHDVYILVLKRYEPMTQEYGIKALVSKDAESQYDAQYIQDMYTEMLENNAIEDPKYVNEFFKFYTSQLINILEEKTLRQQLEGLNFDLAVMDGCVANLASYILPYKLGIPYVTITVPSIWFSWWVRHPRLPSMVPMASLSNNYLTRLKGRLRALVTELAGSFPDLFEYPSDSLISKYAPQRPFKTIFDIFKDAELVLLNGDPNVLDSHTVESTHVKYAGLIGPKPAEPLKGPIEELVSSAEYGVIVLSLPSGINAMPEYMYKTLFDAFKTFPEKFLVRCKGKLGISIPPNVHVMDWFPQNDLLAHPNVKLLITHAGHFGQIEAINNNIPMLMTPFGVDQAYNAMRAQNRGLGKIFNVMTAEPSEIQDLISEMLSNQTYKENMIKLNKLRAALPKAEDTAAFWIDHVLHFGGKHFRPLYLDMPLYEFFCLDIILLVLTIISTVLIILCLSCFKLVKFLFRFKQKID